MIKESERGAEGTSEQGDSCKMSNWVTNIQKGMRSRRGKGADGLQFTANWDLIIGVSPLPPVPPTHHTCMWASFLGDRVRRDHTPGVALRRVTCTTGSGERT